MARSERGLDTGDRDWIVKFKKLVVKVVFGIELMERFEKLVNKEIRELLAGEPDMQARAAKLAKKIFQWLNEGGVDRIEAGLKQEAVSIEKVFGGQEEKVAQDLEER
ncbi:hypothetical protein MYX77_01030 [Acidobacteriia bacterium AH_259_A11_L15]|nr:hypothetical protein [Acidobacteriia bacterium AH_259_A11_L15]